MALSNAQLEKLGLQDFIVVDLETTGLNPVSDEIIEFGAVRFRNGTPKQGVSQLMQASQPLPDLITRITGITDQDLSYSPPAADVLPDLLERWIQVPMVAHNLSFDLEFVNTAMAQFDMERVPFESGLDTLLLSRVFLPGLYSHSLGALVVHLNLPMGTAHRARSDAEATGWLLLALIEIGLNQPQTVLDILARLAPQGATQDLMQRLLEHQSHPSIAESEQEADLEPTEPHTMPLELDDVPLVPIDVEEVGRVFEAGGGLSASMPHFEPRTSQLAMSKDVAKAFNEGAFLVAEAGTGVGKSFAYLVPAHAWSSANPSRAGRVVLSTRTKTLQDQLYKKDIPAVQRILGARWDAVLLKGRQNYLCLRRLDSLLQREMSPEDRAALMPLVTWINQTETGDLEEAHGLWQRDLRHRVNDDPEYCVGRRCGFYDQCYSVNARTAAKRAQLVVVNHALLLADLALEGGILGDYERLIVDEAHHFERAARQVLQRTISYWQFKNGLDELLRRDAAGRETGLLLSLKRLVPETSAGLLDDVNVVSEATFHLRQDLFAFFEALTSFVDTLGSEAGRTRSEYTLKKQYNSDDVATLLAEHQPLRQHVEKYLDAVDKTRSDADSALDGKGEEVLDAIAASLSNQRILLDTLSWLLLAGDETFVYWYELSRKPNALATLSAAPLDVGEPLMALYDRLQSAVLTSATLSVADDFSYFASRIGLDRLPQERVTALNFGQPFHFESAVHLSVPTYLPLPNEAGFPQALAELLYDVTTFTKKHTMALFTSYQLLQAVAGALSDRDLFVCFQGPRESRTRVLEAFRNGPDAALLLGTDSFWEGIDLPGKALEILVITKIPFPVPSDPLVSAEEERLSAVGKSAFQEHSLPQAILTLRQGFGRLLRSQTDRGAVLLTDRRVLQKGYGKRILSAFPCEVHTPFTPSSLMTDLKSFFDQDEPSS